MVYYATVPKSLNKTVLACSGCKTSDKIYKVEVSFAHTPKSMGKTYFLILILIDPQSVGKRTHDLMDTVNAKKRWKTICWRVNKYLK
jgi:hypothetical protein